MDELRIYRRINRKPTVFGIPAPVFLIVMVPLVFAVLFMGIIGGIVVSLVGMILVAGIYFLLKREEKKSGIHFFGKYLHLYYNTFSLVKRTRIHYRVWEDTKNKLLSRHADTKNNKPKP